MVQYAERAGSGHCIEDPAEDEGKEKKEDRRNRSVEHRQSPLWLRGVVWHKVGHSSGHYWQCFMCNGPHCAQGVVRRAGRTSERDAFADLALLALFLTDTCFTR